MKEIRLKKLPPVRFYLFDTLEIGKHNRDKNQIRGFQGLGRGKLFGVTEIFCILIVIAGIQLNTFVKIHYTVPLKGQLLLKVNNTLGGNLN